MVSAEAMVAMRMALAATLSPLWGLYNGFELCEATPIPGREDYLDSEYTSDHARTHSHPHPSTVAQALAERERPHDA